jgi:hypothetical protein
MANLELVKSFVSCLEEELLRCLRESEHVICSDYLELVVPEAIRIALLKEDVFRRLTLEVINYVAREPKPICYVTVPRDAVSDRITEARCSFIIPLRCSRCGVDLLADACAYAFARAVARVFDRSLEIMCPLCAVRADPSSGYKTTWWRLHLDLTTRLVLAVYGLLARYCPDAFKLYRTIVDGVLWLATRDGAETLREMFAANAEIRYSDIEDLLNLV